MGDGWLPTENQRQIVALYGKGYGRWKIAEILDVNEASVRKSVRFLCTRFDCPVRDLPAKLAEFDAAQEFSFRAPGMLDVNDDEAVADFEEYDDADDDGRVTV